MGGRTDVQLANELALLREENKRLRYRVEDDAERRKRLRIERLIDRARTDAELLVTLALALQDVSKRQAPLGSQRWQYAVALLRLARLCPRSGDVKIYGYAAQRAVERLDRAVAVAKMDPSALKLMIPRTRRPALLE